MGPPSVPPYWFSVQGGGSVSPAALSRLLSAFHSSRCVKKKPLPWKALVPLLVTTLITDRRPVRTRP